MPGLSYRANSVQRFTGSQREREREKGRILLPEEQDEKTVGDKVLEVLMSKHPDALKFKAYKICPDFMDLDITEDVYYAAR
jgi:hypothetical protein